MKKNTALYILAVIICLFLAAFVFHVPALRHLFHNLYGILQSPYILVSAAICAFLFINTKNYWLIIAGCGIAFARSQPPYFWQYIDFTKESQTIYRFITSRRSNAAI